MFQLSGFYTLAICWPTLIHPQQPCPTTKKTKNSTEVPVETCPKQRTILEPSAGHLKTLHARIWQLVRLTCQGTKVNLWGQDRDQSTPRTKLRLPLKLKPLNALY